MVGLLITGLIIWFAVRASQRYKAEKVDVEKEDLLAEIERLKATNRKLAQRNMDLSKMMNKKLLYGP